MPRFLAILSWPTLTGLLAGTLVLCCPPIHGQQITDTGLFNTSAEAAFSTLGATGVYDDQQELERLQRIGYAVARHSGFEKYPFSFYLIDMAIPNAFALPAGHIFVTRGMIGLGLDDDMLAGLLGHEIAHVTQEHFVRMKKRSTALTALTSVLSLGSIYAASQMGGDTWVDPYGYPRSSNQAAEVAQGMMAGSMVLSELLLRSYSRGFEDEADEEGQRFAAAAGYNPEGTERLMAKMKSRLPQDQNFGYWQTHPFFEERVRAAKARKDFFTVQQPKPVDAYRQQTQRVLLSFIDTGRLKHQELVPMLRETALVAWPQGELAEGIRIGQLHDQRGWLRDKQPLERDYNRLLEIYAKHLNQVRTLTPESAFIGTLEAESQELRTEVEQLYPTAVAQIDSEVTQLPVLATFVRNYPDSDRLPQVAMTLGESYARLGRETEAVENFLLAWNSDPDGPLGTQARRGLRSFVPVLQKLAAVQQLADQPGDPELQQLADRRLEELVKTYKDLENGGSYLHLYPEGDFSERVRLRQNRLAEEIYKEVILYQGIGDQTKAVKGIERILTWAPFSPAARRLSEEAVVEEG